MQPIVLFLIKIKVYLSIDKFIVVLLFILHLLKIQHAENKIISNKGSRNYLRLLFFII